LSGNWRVEIPNKILNTGNQAEEALILRENAPEFKDAFATLRWCVSQLQMKIGVNASLWFHWQGNMMLKLFNNNTFI
jgi:hypothetical protein